MNVNASREVLSISTGVEVGPSTTENISKSFPITAGGAQHFRADVYVGKIVGTVDFGLSHSSGFNIWTPTKTTPITASTDISCTINTSTDVVTATGHGFQNNDAVVFNAATLPEPLQPNEVCYVSVIDANNFYATKSNGTRINFTTTGSSVTVTKVRLFTLILSANIASDVSSGYIPLRSQGVITLTTGAGESAQIVGVRILQED